MCRAKIICLAVFVFFSPVTRGQQTIAEPAGSSGYRCSAASALEKVYRDDDFAAQTADRVQVSAARNESVSFQIVVESPWRKIDDTQIRFDDFVEAGGARIPAAIARWKRVEYVRVDVKPPYRVEHAHEWYPDPLLPPGPFAVEKGSRVPIWVTLTTPVQCAAGPYHGRVEIVVADHEKTLIPIDLQIWDFALTNTSHLRTMTWLSTDSIRAFYGNDESAEGQRRQSRAIENYQNILLEHRLGPGGDVVSNLKQCPDGTYDFARVDATLKRLIGRGMNAFIIGTAPNLDRLGKKEYSPQFLTQFPPMIRAYMDHLDQQGLSDLAYVYTYDEAPADAWDQVKAVSAAVKKAAPNARIFQCLNQPKGVAALTGSVDVFDVYVQQYHKAGVARAQQRGAEAWLALCCYPADHPNFFLEYQLTDVRATPWICWKYHAQGFEYWSPNSWGANARTKGAKWPQAPWISNAFKHYNGDGYLLYPGADGQPCSSLRLEALRDGLQDYEYLWTLDSLVKRASEHGSNAAELEGARRLLSLAGMIDGNGVPPSDPQTYLAYRQHLAEAIVRLSKGHLNAR